MTNILKETDAGRMEPREGVVALAGRQGGLWQWRMRRIDGEEYMSGATTVEQSDST